MRDNKHDPKPGWFRRYRGLLLGVAAVIVLAVVGYELQTPSPSRASDTDCYVSSQTSAAAASECKLSNDKLFRDLKEAGEEARKIQKMVFGWDGSVEVFTTDGRLKTLWITGDSERAQMRELAVKAQEKGIGLTWEDAAPPSEGSGRYFLIFGPPVLIISVWIASMIWLPRLMGGKQMKGLGFSFGNKNGRTIRKEIPNITLNDVAGMDEVRDDFQDIVRFLEDPVAYCAMGAKPPKGSLLVGPPGNGKTLAARGLAGTAKVPFFALSGSDFVEVVVGVGAGRVRSLFDEMKKNAPCIGFIDEIDAVGRTRNKGGAVGGNEEREQTLNALLAEMEGFDKNPGVILIAATNRADVLDKALVDRFKKPVHVPNPDLASREKIAELQLKEIPAGKLAADLTPHEIGLQTFNMSGRQIVNIINEAINLATKRRKKQTELSDFVEAVQTISLGAERRSQRLSEETKDMLSKHEGAHALVGLIEEINGAEPLHSLTIIPRGPALGLAWFRPAEDRVLMKFGEAKAFMAVGMAGREAERLMYDNNEDMISSGAKSDIRAVSRVAREVILELGFGGPKLGSVDYSEAEGGLLARHDWSQDTKNEIDLQVRTLVAASEKRAQSHLLKYKAAWLAISNAVRAQETLSRPEAEDIVCDACPELEEVLVLKHRKPKKRNAEAATAA